MKSPSIAPASAVRGWCAAVLGLTLPLALVACGEKGARRPGIDPAPEAQAPLAIRSSFLVEKLGDGKETDRARIAIAQDALGKEFLLQSGITVMPFLGTSNGNLSRIVTFRTIDGALWMFDAAAGKVATTDIPQTFVLAKFPVTFQSETHIFFDFNAGMSDLFVGEEWRASDFSGTDVTPDSGAIKTRLSYLEDAVISPANELVIRQIAQVDMPDTSIPGRQDHTTVELKYYLTAYAPTAGFAPTESPGFSQFGYFEVAPRFNPDGTTVVHATKFADGPITFAISANTPAEVHQAVKDGVLYWNKAFGEERLQVVDAPADVNAPDFNYNVVQWVTWDDAGFAYADAQADPRTGETLHAQVYMTSVFWVSGLARAKQWLERVGALTGAAPVGPTSRPAAAVARPKSLALRGFQGGHLCLADMTKDFTALLTELVLEEADDAKIRRITSDYIREVVAHEIGHTLGLRHNFAGSQAATFPVSELETVFKDYAQNGAAPLDKIPSNSVMEYQTFLNGALTGDLLVRSLAPLDYDAQAIGFLYSGATAPGAAPQPFCTDTAENLFADCKVFDEGKVVADSLVRAFRASTRILEQKIPDGSGAEIPLVYFLDADLVAEAILAPLAESAALAGGSTRLLAVRQMSGLPPSLEPVFRAQERDQLLAEITAAGGFDAVLPLAPAMPDPVVPALAPAREHLTTRVASKLLDILATPSAIVDHALGEAFAVHLGKAARNVTLAEAATPLVVTITKPDGTTATLTLPTYKFDTSMRARAAALLGPGRGESPAFALAESLAVKADLKTKLDAALGADVATVDLTTLPAAAGKWVVENRAVLAGFGR